jgi:hypothetical protein
MCLHIFHICAFLLLIRILAFKTFYDKKQKTQVINFIKIFLFLLDFKAPQEASKLHR